jgi:hypothetical protein
MQFKLKIEWLKLANCPVMEQLVYFAKKKEIEQFV